MNNALLSAVRQALHVLWRLITISVFGTWILDGIIVLAAIPFYYAMPEFAAAVNSLWKTFDENPRSAIFDSVNAIQGIILILAWLSFFYAPTFRNILGGPILRKKSEAAATPTTS